MTIQEGDTLPAVTLTTMTEEGPKPIDLQELCDGKKVVLLGACPTCAVKR